MRELFLDRSAGEIRGVVTFNRFPERLLIERGADQPACRLGARSVARLARIERALGIAFLELPDGGAAAAPIPPGVAEGAFLEIEIAAEARAGKVATARMTGAAAGPVRLLEVAQTLESQLVAFAPGVHVTEGASAREAANEAQEAVLTVEHALPGGGSIAIETTRALTAVDVDLGSRIGGDARRATRQANLTAIDMAARLLRLKGVGGLVVIDLAGKGHDGAAMSAAAKTAFAVDGSQVSIGPISRFGLFELSLPRHRRPTLEILTGGGQGSSSLTKAFDLLRALEREGRANPGARLTALAAPMIVEAATPHLSALTDRLGARFSLSADVARTDFEVHVL